MVPSGPAGPHVVYSTLVCVGTMYTAYIQPLALTGILNWRLTNDNLFHFLHGDANEAVHLVILHIVAAPHRTNRTQAHSHNIQCINMKGTS